MDGIRPLSKRQKLFYILGNFGWSLVQFAPTNLLIFFYLPPHREGAERLFPQFLTEGKVLGALTFLGLIAFAARLLDAFIDPLVAYFSDRSQSRFGRRNSFLIRGALPFAIFSWLVFNPPFGQDFMSNQIYVAATLALFYVFFTIYVIPFGALLAEYGHTEKERMTLATFGSVAWFLGFMSGTFIYGLWPVVQRLGGFEAAEAFRWTISGYCGIGFLFMLLPALGIREKNHSSGKSSNEKFVEVFRSVLSDRNYRVFVAADFLYWMALSFIQLGSAYFFVTLLGLGSERISMFMAIMFLTSIACYWPINIIVRKIGKKKMLMIAFVGFSLTFLLCALFNKAYGRPELQALVMVLSGAIPLGVFGIVPAAVVADTSARAMATGPSRAAAYYSVRNFMMKMGISLANLVFPSFLLIRFGAGEETGVRVAALTAMVLSLLGCFALSFYTDVGFKKKETQA